MKGNRESLELLLSIKNEIPGFNKEELLEYLKWSIPRLYNSVINQKEPDVKCKTELVDKLNNQKLRYRITKNMDHMNVQYAELFDNVKKDNEMYIQVYLSIYFYDRVKNNIGNTLMSDRYWNDIWIITCKKNIKPAKVNSNCVNCGAVMKYIKAKEVFECKYCGNIINNKINSDWEIIDIEKYLS